MRFPWQKRTDEERRRREVDERRLAAVMSDWPDVIAHAERLQYERELNGWTGIAAALFSGQKGRQ